MRKFLFAIVLTTLFTSSVISGETNAQPTFQTIRGTVINSLTNLPVEGAYIVITSCNPVKHTTSTNSGEFRITGVPVGSHTLNVLHLGYEKEIIPGLVVSSGKELVISIGITEAADTLEAAKTIYSHRKDQPLNKMAIVSSRSFSVDETSRYAGGLNDPARLVTSFAGVSGGDLQDNAISIRGNTPKSVLWRVEGAAIPAPNHFSGGTVAGGGFVSILSNQMVSNSDFLTGAFPAEYGNAISGVFDIKMRTGNNQKHEHTVGISTVGVDLSSEGPVFGKNRASYLFNYRYSTMGLLTKARVLKEEQIPTFQDFAYKVTVPINRFGSVNIWGIAGKGNTLEPSSNDSLTWKTQSDRIGYDWDNVVYAHGINHRYFGTSSYSMFTSAVISKKYDDFNFVRLDDNLTESSYLNIKEKEVKYNISHTSSLRVSQILQLKAGVDLSYIKYNNDIWSNKSEYDPSTYSKAIEGDGSTLYIGSFVNGYCKASNNVVLNAGIHVNYFEMTKDYNIEPRIGLRWEVNRSHNLSAGFGMHNQIEPLKIYLVKSEDSSNGGYPNKDLGLTKANHFILAHDWKISEYKRLKTELYYQQLSDIPGIADSSYSLINYKQEYAFRERLSNNSSGYNMGIEITFERFFNNKFYYMANLSLFDSKYRADDNILRNTRYNKNVLFNLLGGKDFSFQKNRKVLSLNLRLSYTGGERYTPVSHDESINKREAVFDYSRAFESKYPADLFTDISISLRFNKKRYSSVLSAQIKNALANKTRRGTIFNLKTGRLEEDTYTVVVPVIGYKIEF